MPLYAIRSRLAADGPAALRGALVELQRLIDGKETLMGTRSESLAADDHRRLGIDLYNRTWTLMDTPGDEMLHCAHASAYHWMQSGATPANRARSEWLCSRVYTLLGRSEPALQHARRCRELVESSPAEMEEWDLPAAYEALARAHLVAGEESEAACYKSLGLEALAKVADEEDRQQIEADLASIP